MKKLFTLGLVIALVFMFSQFVFAGKDCDKEKHNQHHGHKHGHDGCIPAMKDFHDVLAKVWHTYLPEKDYASIRKDAPKMAGLMETVKKAELPKSVKDVEAAKKQIDVLAKAVDNLVVVAKEADDEKLSAAVTSVHEEFVTLKGNCSHKKGGCPHKK